MPKVILGFDYGSKRIGVAVGQMITRTATPLSPIPAQNGIPNWDSIKQLIKTWNADTLVVGMPYNMDASVSDMVLAATRFQQSLRQHCNIPVFGSDERLTTFAARQQLAAAEKSKHSLDSVAAQIILEQWMRNQNEL